LEGAPGRRRTRRRLKVGHRGRPKRASSENRPPPRRKIGMAMRPQRSGYSKPPLVQKKPLGRWTPMMATPIRDGDGERRRPRQKAGGQRQAAEELDHAGEQGKNDARMQSDRVEELPRGRQPVASEPAEELLGTMRDEQEARRDPHERPAQLGKPVESGGQRWNGHGSGIVGNAAHGDPCSKKRAGAPYAPRSPNLGQLPYHLNWPNCDHIYRQG
jgi:hypothetical protein